MRATRRRSRLLLVIAWLAHAGPATVCCRRQDPNSAPGLGTEKCTARRPGRDRRRREPRARRRARGGCEGVRSAMEWAQVRALAADGVSQTQIAERLGINRRTVKRLLDADAPPCYRRPPAGSVLGRLGAGLPQGPPGGGGIKGARGAARVGGGY